MSSSNPTSSSHEISIIQGIHDYLHNLQQSLGHQWDADEEYAWGVYDLTTKQYFRHSLAQREQDWFKVESSRWGQMNRDGGFGDAMARTQVDMLVKETCKVLIAELGGRESAKAESDGGDKNQLRTELDQLELLRSDATWSLTLEIARQLCLAASGVRKCGVRQPWCICNR